MRIKIDKMNKTDDPTLKGIIPTYEARLMLQHHEDFKKHKRDVDLPFCTR